MLDYAQARRLMVDCQLRTYDVTDAALLAAFDAVPREAFVAAGHEPFAYADRDVPASVDGSRDGTRQVLAPMVLARLIQALAVRPGSRVLDVAGGLGYAAALLSQLGADVRGLESEALAEEAARRLAAGGYPVPVHAGAIEAGYAADAPYDAILLNGAVEARPDALIAPLREGGRLACVIGRGRAAKATLFVRGGEGAGSRSLFDAAAPLLDAFRVAPSFVF
jgi:protein-L-isoaspartate(D-aspartate) O-methyltransferase